MNMKNSHILIGVTNFRNPVEFYIKDQDRLGHLYCIGKTGVGKSTLLENMAISDIEKGKGLCIIDPHGDIAQDILKPVVRLKIYYKKLSKKLCMLLKMSNLKAFTKHFLMHNFTANLAYFMELAKESFKDEIDVLGNFKFYPRQPKIPDIQLIAMSILAEAEGIDSENLLYAQIKACH